MLIGRRRRFGATAVALLTAGAVAVGVCASAASATTSTGGTTDGTSTTSAVTTSALRSGLPWASGVYIPGKDPAKHTAFGDYRGAPTDVVVTWPARRSWSDLTNAGWMYAAWSPQPQTTVYGFPPIPQDGVSTLAACATGAYNEHWRTIGQQLQATGTAHKTIIRLGWEFNGDWYDWAARKPSEFAECWRQIHRTADAQAPGLRWDWNVNRGISQIGIDPRNAYPGDAYVDIVGIDSYDWYPAALDEASWQKHYAGSEGLKYWADFARSRGKRLSVPEWGVYPGTAGAAHSGGDNPFYIQKMLGFFYEQRDNLAYEAYFNTDAAYYAGSLYAPVQVPKASGEYARLIRAYAAGTAAGPVAEPTVEPTPKPVVEPTQEPVVEPTQEPVVEPTLKPSPTADAAPVVRVSVPVAKTTSDGVTVQAEISVDRATSFAKRPRVAIRDALGGSTDASGGLDTAFGPALVESTSVLSGTRALAAGTYTAFVAYSIDGTTWVRGAGTTFTVPSLDSTGGLKTSPSPSPTATRTSPYKRFVRPRR